MYLTLLVRVPWCRCRMRNVPCEEPVPGSSRRSSGSSGSAARLLLGDPTSASKLPALSLPVAPPFAAPMPTGGPSPAAARGGGGGAPIPPPWSATYTHDKPPSQPQQAPPQPPAPQPTAPSAPAPDDQSNASLLQLSSSVGGLTLVVEHTFVALGQHGTLKTSLVTSVL